MDQNLVVLTAKRMTDARAALIRDNPFFGHLALGLKLSCAPCGTACTDGERLIFDPTFAEKLKNETEMRFVILHELLHCVLEHCTRGNSLNQELFNIACDIVVNSTILGMWGLTGFRVAGEDVMHLAPDGQEGRIYNAEEVYHMLLSREQQQKDSPGKSGRPGKSGKSGNPGGDPSSQTLDRHDIWQGIGQKERIRDAWNREIVKAASACGGSEQLPPSIRELADALLNRSKADWKQILHDFIQYDTYDYNFLPPDRRFSDSDFFLPAYNIDEDQGSAHDLWVCVDASGSISDQQLSDFLSEVRDAMRQAGLSGMLSFFDTWITTPKPFESEAELHMITPEGGGGTSFHVIFRHLREHLLAAPPKAILVFTDGFVAQWPEEWEAMGIPVLWLICKDGNAKAPWGRVVQL